jgi:hypothetical protein
MKRPAPLRRAPLARVSLRRLQELALYWERRRRFLREHPFCEFWLACRGVTQAEAIAARGWVCRHGVWRRAPRSSEVHHRDKRRGGRLLDETQWLAVSRRAHRFIEEHKGAARALGFLRPI